MHTILRYHDYFKEAFRKVLMLFIFVVIAGNIIDLYNTPSTANIVLNLTTILLFISLLIGHFKFEVSIKLCFTIGIYTVFTNLIISQITESDANLIISFFFRESLFVVLIIIMASIFIGRKHAFIISTLYLIFYVYITITHQNNFLQDNLLLIIIVIGAFTATMYFFVTVLHQSIYTLQEQSLTIYQQNSYLTDSNIQLEESNARITEQSEEITTMAEILKKESDELQLKYKELKELNDTKDKFFSIVAHDLKGPISSLAGLSEIILLKFEQMSEDRKRKNIENILKGTNNLYQLLENLLQWSRSQTNSIKVNIESIELKQLVENVIRLVTIMAGNKKVIIDNRISENATVQCDKMMLETIIRNLLTNAIKYSYDNRIIIIGTEPKDDTLITYIKDKGIGIPLELQPKLFSIANKFSMTGTNGEKGTGLGLILTKEFIEKNNGTIWFESLKDEGTTFYFKLPCN